MRIVAILAVVALLVAAGVAFFAGRDGDEKDLTEESSAKHVDLKLRGVKVETAGPPVELSQDVSKQVMQAVGVYVDEGLIEPLLTGEAPGKNVAALFDSGGGARLDGFDRAALFDEGLPEVTTDKAQSNGVFLTGLSDRDGQVVLISAALVVKVSGKTDDGAVEIRRALELTFANDGGTWKITGYDVRVERSGAGVDSAAEAER